MSSQLSYHVAEAHHQDLLRAAKAARVADELPRQRRFTSLHRVLAAVRFGGQPAQTSVGSTPVEVSPSV